MKETNPFTLVEEEEEEEENPPSINVTFDFYPPV